ncbi:hypothetical protein Dda_3593 [Drechslerella dactyloides]|uniref:Uncharacterized protein n=1 Tax=Drechslerella dactyloides TaxID=74499 RepID=A0AAD6NJY1_DREDA|nr:hypothetical protein Dda_3593 [Drechslerella dactyloides]
MSKPSTSESAASSPSDSSTSSSRKRNHEAISPVHRFPPDNALMSETGDTDDEVEPQHRGADILHNHLIIEYIVKYLPDVMDIIHLRRTCRSVARDVKHYLVRNASSLDFSTTPGIHDIHIRRFLRGVSDANLDPGASFKLQQWSCLTHLDLSNTGISEKMMANIIIQTFDGINHSEFVSGFSPGSEANPECFMHLESITAQKCPGFNVDIILSLLQKLLFKRLDKYWEQEEAAVGGAWQVLRQVKSPIGSQIWRGPLPVNSEELDKTGLVGYTRLKKLYLANSGKLAVEKRIWQGVEEYWNEDQCPYNHNAARYLCITGALGLETELRFCNSYCDSHNVFLWDGWTMEDISGLEDDYSQMRTHHNIHKQIKMEGMSKFPQLRYENPIPRMPWETRIQHTSGQTFYFPGSGADHKDQLHIDDISLSMTLLCDSTIDKLVSHFERYPKAEKRHALNKMTGVNWEKPEGWEHPDPQGQRAENERYFGYIFRYCLRERNSHLHHWAMPNAPRTDLTTGPPYPALPDLHMKLTEVEYVIKRMMRCPLPRRLWVSNLLNPNVDHHWWDKRNVAMLEHPRGLCDNCEREVWLCPQCNRNQKAFCAECMIIRGEQTNTKHLAE